MLRIAKAEDQALRLSMRLARQSRQVTLGELADLEGLPEPTVAKLLSFLRRNGVVTALRGRNGGYELAAPPAEISVAAVLRSLGDPAPPHACIESDDERERCPRSDDCGLRSVWRHLQKRVIRLLEGTSLADLLRAETAVDEHVVQLWPDSDRTAGGSTADRRHEPTTSQGVEPE